MPLAEYDAQVRRVPGEEHLELSGERLTYELWKGKPEGSIYAHLAHGDFGRHIHAAVSHTTVAHVVVAVHSYDDIVEQSEKAKRWFLREVSGRYDR